MSLRAIAEAGPMRPQAHLHWESGINQDSGVLPIYSPVLLRDPYGASSG